MTCYFQQIVLLSSLKQTYVLSPEFYLFECRKCKDRFATPFLASFHIKEGRCKQEDGELSPDGEKVISFNTQFLSISHLNFVCGSDAERTGIRVVEPFRGRCCDKGLNINRQ